MRAGPSASLSVPVHQGAAHTRGPHASHLTPRTSRLSPLASRLSSLASSLSPLASHLSRFCTSHLSPLFPFIQVLHTREDTIYPDDFVGEHVIDVTEALQKQAGYDNFKQGVAAPGSAVYHDRVPSDFVPPPFSSHTTGYVIPPSTSSQPFTPQMAGMGTPYPVALAVPLMPSQPSGMQPMGKSTPLSPSPSPSPSPSTSTDTPLTPHRQPRPVPQPTPLSPSPSQVHRPVRS